MLFYAMESASLHLSQLKIPAKAHLGKQVTNLSKVGPIRTASGSKDGEKVSAQSESARSVQREALKLTAHKQTLLRQIDLADSIVQSVGALLTKAEYLKEHALQEAGLTASQEMLQSDMDLEKESVGIEEQVLNVLERRVSEYETLVIKLTDRSSRLFALYYEAKDLITQLNSSNDSLIKRHLAEKALSSELGTESRPSEDKRPRPDGRRTTKRTIKR